MSIIIFLNSKSCFGSLFRALFPFHTGLLLHYTSFPFFFLLIISHTYFIFSFRLFYHWTFKKSMQTGREVVSGSRSQAWSQCCHYLKRPKATSPIPPCALKFHPRPVRTHIQDQKAPVLFYTAAPVPTFCFDLISLISGTWEFLLFFPSSEFKLCIYSFALVLCYILICS